MPMRFFCSLPVLLSLPHLLLQRFFVLTLVMVREVGGTGTLHDPGSQELHEEVVDHV